MNNKDWYGRMSTVAFLRVVGKHMRLADMLNKESVKVRMKKGRSVSHG